MAIVGLELQPEAVSKVVPNDHSLEEASTGLCAFTLIELSKGSELMHGRKDIPGNGDLVLIHLISPDGVLQEIVEVLEGSFNGCLLGFLSGLLHNRILLALLFLPALLSLLVPVEEGNLGDCVGHFGGVIETRASVLLLSG